jgi:uncharacterized SAM-binding protein YcdF (DUF218 family)
MRFFAPRTSRCFSFLIESVFSLFKNVRRLLKIALLAGFCLLASVVVALLFPRQLLTVDSGPVKADAIVILGGGGVERPKRALELFTNGAAPRIICSGNGDAQWNKSFLVRKGVPADAVLVENESSNTQQNARLSIALLRKQGAKRVIVVTTWFHSRRALECFRHYASDIEFYSCPSYFGYEPEEMKRAKMREAVYSEYLKLLGYWVRYGVWPF